MKNRTPANNLKSVPAPSSRKRLTLICAITALALSAAGAVWYCTRKVAPASDSPEDIAKFIASAGFNKLSAAERRAYMAKLRQGRGERPPRGGQQQMSQAERKSFRDNTRRLFEQERNARMRKYFSLKTQEEKDAFLDEELARMEQRRAEFEKRRKQRMAEREKQKEQNKAQGENPQPPKRPTEAERTENMRTRMETSTPESRAMRSKYFRELSARAKATGKSFGPPGGGRRGAPR